MGSSGTRECKSVMILPRAKVGGHPRRVQESPESNTRQEFKVDSRRMFRDIDPHNCGDPLSLRRIGIQSSPQPPSFFMHVDFTRPMLGTWRRRCCDTQQAWRCNAQRQRECVLTLHRKSCESDLSDSLRMVERMVGNARRREDVVARLRKRVVLVGWDRVMSEKAAKQQDERVQRTESAKWHRLHSGSRSASSLLHPATARGCESAKVPRVHITNERKMPQRSAHHVMQNQALQSNSRQGAPDLQQNENIAAQVPRTVSEGECVFHIQTKRASATNANVQRRRLDDSLRAVLSDLDVVDHRLTAYKRLMRKEIDRTCIHSFATLDSLYTYKTRQRSEECPSKSGSHYKLR